MSKQRLCTPCFIRICLANLSLFVSFYLLLSALPYEMSARFGAAENWIHMFTIPFLSGMFAIGPFHAYLMDAYKRKSVYMLSFALVMASSVGYMFVSSSLELIVLSAVQGGAMGMAATAGITLAIDMTASSLRSAGNIRFAWMSCVGMVCGVMLGAHICRLCGFSNLLAVSVAMGLLGILSAWGVYVPFRAPIVTKLFSFDRFLLFRGVVPSVSVVLSTFIIGLFIPSKYTFGAIPSFPFFAGVVAGLFISVCLVRLNLLKKDVPRLIAVGLSFEALAVFLMPSISPLVVSVLLGIGLGCTLPEFLVMFVKLSHHCQRGTANTMHLLSVETGILLGLTSATRLEEAEILLTARMLSIITLAYFCFVAYPYYVRMKVR